MAPSRRTVLLASLACALPLAALPAVATDAPPPPGAAKQSVNGTIATFTRFPNTATTSVDAGWPGLARRLYQGSSASNGVIAHVFTVDPATWGGAFVISGVTDATGAADLDVYFYDEMGDLGGQTAGVTTAEYATVAKGGETGFVAPGSRKAIVYTRNGVQSAFSYTGYAPPRIDLAGSALDLTVANGATVTWVNGTSDYGFVRHTPASGKRLFDSSPKAGTGIPSGGTFSYRFTKPGTYTYESSAGTGTVTVTEGPGVGTPAG